MNSVGSIFAVLMLIVVVLTGMQIVGEQSVNNSNLDLESTNLIGNYSDTLNTELNYTSSFNDFEGEIPKIITLSLGVPADLVVWINGFIALIVVTLLGFAGFRVLFGGGKITSN